MAIDLPVVGQQNWGEPLNVALRDMDVTRPGSLAEVELSARLSAAAGSAEGMVQAAITASRPPLYGTGFPNGKVAAPVGTLYSDGAVTNGASLWQKVSGVGNTGWVVVAGDTGWRNMKLEILEPFVSPVSMIHLSRVGNVVTAAGRLSPTLGLSPQEVKNVFVVPPGFRKFTGVNLGSVWFQPSRSVGAVTAFYGSANFEVSGGTVSPGQEMHPTASWVTADPWPATLPGTN